LVIYPVKIDNPKIKNVYVPSALAGLAVVLLLVEVLFISKDASADVLEKILTIAVKIILYTIVLLLCIGLCSWLGYPFDPVHWSLLQLLAIVLLAGALRGSLGILIGDMFAVYVSIAFGLGLIGYFFNDEPMNALIAIFIIFAAHSVVTFLLMPLLAMFLA
jgi:hypothetical protein